MTNAITVDELLKAIKDSGLKGSAKVFVGHEGKRVTQREVDSGEQRVYRQRAVVSCTENVGLDALLIIFEEP